MLARRCATGKIHLGAVFVLLTVLAFTGYFIYLKQTASQKNGSDKPPVPSVVTAQVAQQDFPIFIDVTGSAAAANIVDVRPQVSNVVTKIHIQEGQTIKAGDLLFTLDDRADRANFEKARAQADDAARQYRRAQALLEQNFVSQASVDTTLTNLNTAQAALRAAEVALSYDSIRAPISGKTGVIHVFPGSLVQPGNAVSSTTSATTSAIGAMVTIAQLDPIYAQFTVPETLAASLQRMMHNGQAPVATVELADGTMRAARVSVVDNQVDIATGSVKVKARLDNADHLLIPGQFLRIRLHARTLKDALTIPSQALISNTQGNQVYVVDAANKVALRPVKILAQSGGQMAVEGLEPGMRIVIEGKQNLRPGGSVQEAKPHHKNAAAS